MLEQLDSAKFMPVDFMFRIRQNRQHDIYVTRSLLLAQQFTASILSIYIPDHVCTLCSGVSHLYLGFI